MSEVSESQLRHVGVCLVQLNVNKEEMQVLPNFAAIRPTTGDGNPYLTEVDTTLKLQLFSCQYDTSSSNLVFIIPCEFYSCY